MNDFGELMVWMMVGGVVVYGFGYLVMAAIIVIGEAFGKEW